MKKIINALFELFYSKADEEDLSEDETYMERVIIIICLFVIIILTGIGLNI